MRTLNVRRMTLMAAAIAVLVAAVSVAAAVRPVGAAGPTDGIDTQELNVDVDGFIAIHEQGVADVNVIGGDVGVTVDDSTPIDVNVGNVVSVDVDSDTDEALTRIEAAIDNLADVVSDGPDAAPVSRSEIFGVRGNDSELWEIQPLLLSNMTVSSNNDNAQILLVSNEQTVFNITSISQNLPSVLNMPFSRPLLVDRLVIVCLNSLQNCEITVTLLGTSP